VVQSRCDVRLTDVWITWLRFDTSSLILSLPVSLYSLSSPCCLFHSSSSHSLFSFNQRAIRKFDIISEILSTSLPAYRRLSSGRRVATSGPSCSAWSMDLWGELTIISFIRFTQFWFIWNCLSENFFAAVETFLNDKV